MRKVFYFLIFALGYIHPLLGANLNSPLQIQLQWIESSGSVVNIQWPVQVDWIWKQVSQEGVAEHLEAFVQVSIELPKQLSVSLPSGSRARMQESVSGTSTLVIETQSPTLIERLEIGSDAGTGDPTGLAVTLTSTVPKLLIHPSCKREGLRLEETLTGAKFLFLSATCRREGKSPVVSFQASHDAELLASTEKTNGTVRISNLLSKDISQYDFHWFKVGFERAIQREVVKAPVVNPEETWTFFLKLTPNLLFYSKSDAELNFNSNLRAIHRIGATAMDFEAELNLPLIPLSQSPFQPLASGVYQSSLRIKSPRYHPIPSGDFRVNPGMTWMGVHLKQRNDPPGFLWGPEAVFEFIHEKQPKLSTHVGCALLSGSGFSPFFNSYRLSTFFSYPLIPSSGLSMTAGVDYMKLNRTIEQSIDMTSISVGWIVGY